MSFFVKNRTTVRLAPLFLASATVLVAAQTLTAQADSEDSRLFFAEPGPGQAELGTPSAPQAQPAAPAPAAQPRAAAVVRARAPSTEASVTSEQDQVMRNALRAQDSMQWRAYSEVY